MISSNLSPIEFVPMETTLGQEAGNMYIEGLAKMGGGGVKETAPKQEKCKVPSVYCALSRQILTRRTITPSNSSIFVLTTTSTERLQTRVTHDGKLLCLTYRGVL